MSGIFTNPLLEALEEFEEYADKSDYKWNPEHANYYDYDDPNWEIIEEHDRIAGVVIPRWIRKTKEDKQCLE